MMHQRSGEQYTIPLTGIPYFQYRAVVSPPYSNSSVDQTELQPNLKQDIFYCSDPAERHESFQTVKIMAYG